MRAFLYTGGEVFPEGVSERPGADDLVIAADSGLKTARLFGIEPTVLVGDFDSLGEPGEMPGVEIIRVPAEKNETDTQLAASVARGRGATSLVIIGGFGGRLDHSLANLSLLEALYGCGVSAVMTNGRVRARFVKDDGALLVRDSHFRYFSIIPVSDKVKGVTIEGGKYPLKKATLNRRDVGFSISNEIEKNAALISIRSGSALILECADQ